MLFWKAICAAVGTHLETLSPNRDSSLFIYNSVSFLFSELRARERQIISKLCQAPHLQMSEDRVSTNSVHSCQRSSTDGPRWCQRPLGKERVEIEKRFCRKSLSNSTMEQDRLKLNLLISESLGYYLNKPPAREYEGAKPVRSLMTWLLLARLFYARGEFLEARLRLLPKCITLISLVRYKITN